MQGMDVGFPAMYEQEAELLFQKLQKALRKVKKNKKTNKNKCMKNTVFIIIVCNASWGKSPFYNHLTSIF